MTDYSYIARTADGEEVAGVIQADSESAVVRTLDERELFPVRVSERAEAARLSVGGRVRARDLGMMFSQLADLLRAGVPVIRSLRTVAVATTNRKLKAVVLRVQESVSAGRTLADAMAEHPDVFKPLHSAMVHAGERAGFLEEVLMNLSEFLDRQDELRSKVRGAIVYPAVLTCIGVGAMIFILVSVVPKFRTVFGDPTKLPVPTRFLFAISGFLTNNWAIVLGMLVVVAVAVVSLVRSDGGRRAWGRWQMRIPLVGKLLRTVSITRFCRILGTMLGNGVQILQALAISKDASGSPVLAESIERATESVRAGEPLAEPLRAGGLFPVDIVEMIAVAEESNQLEKVLVRIADSVDRRMNRQVDQAIRLIEPLILVVIAAMIGFIALGLLYPIFNMSRSLR